MNIDGSVFDASEKHGTPLEYKAGSGQIIPGLDNAWKLVKNVKITPE